MLADDDLAALCLVPGVGKKTAARLLVELKSRLDMPGLDAAALVGAAGASAGGAGGAAWRRPLADVRDALAGLGYGPDEVAEAVRDLPDDGDRPSCCGSRSSAWRRPDGPRRAALARARTRRRRAGARATASPTAPRAPI